MDQKGEPYQILILEDHPVSATLLTRTLLEAGIPVKEKVIDNREDFESSIHPLSCSMVFIDYHIPGMDCRESIEAIRRIDEEVPVIVVSGNIGEETAVEMIRAGASDLLLKENMNRLPALFNREMKRVRKRRAEAKALQNAREIETQYSNFVSSTLEVIPDGVVVMSAEFEPLMVNVGFQQIAKNYAEMFECTTEELQNEILSNIARAIQSGMRSEITVRKKKKDPPSETE